MNTKLKVFLAHDPGGYDVVYPVFQQYQQAGLPAELYCVGPAVKLNPAYAITEEAFRGSMRDRLLPVMSVLITGTSWGSDFELQMLLLCKQSGIKTVCILDYWSNYALRLRDQRQTYVYPDYYIVMDELAKQEAIQEGVPASILYELGHPGLDRFLNETAGSPREGASRKVLFLCQPLSQLYGDSLGYTEAQVLSDCYQAFTNPNWVFHVKFHPKDTDEMRMAFKKCSIEGNLLELIPEYDLIISMNSMGLLHAVLLGIPAISYQPSLCQPDMCITNKLGLTPLITKYDSLLHAIHNEQLIVQLKERIANAKQEIPWLDGQSAERIFRFIEEF